MTIAIDARMYQESGIGRYIRNLIENLQSLDKKNEYYIFLTRRNYDTLVYHNKFKKILADFGWYGVAEQINFLKILDEIKPDLTHFTHFNVPIFYTRKFVVTIHDLIHQHFSMQRATTRGSLIYKIKQLGYKKIFLHAIKKSEKILVPSNFVKKQLIDEWEVDGGKIIVTPEAVDDKIRTSEGIMSTGIESPYIFYVGNAHPHKNVEGLIMAFKKVKAFLKLKEKYKNLSLVLSGADHYFWQRIKKAYKNDRIIYTGYVSDEKLAALYKNAEAFIMPSFEEGFGIPILEAFALGCPVVSSNGGALPEVGGDAALYFDPFDTSDVSSKIAEVLDDENLRKSLIDKGKKRAKIFSWKKLTKQTLEVYEQCV